MYGMTEVTAEAEGEHAFGSAIDTLVVMLNN